MTKEHEKEKGKAPPPEGQEETYETAEERDRAFAEKARTRLASEEARLSRPKHRTEPLTRKEMEVIILRGESVSWQGEILDHVDLLPDQEEIDRGLEAAKEGQLATITHQRRALDRQEDALRTRQAEAGGKPKPEKEEKPEKEPPQPQQPPAGQPSPGKPGQPPHQPPHSPPPHQQPPPGGGKR